MQKEQQAKRDQQQLNAASQNRQQIEPLQNARQALGNTAIDELVDELS
jgi:hypothetical protein